MGAAVNTPWDVLLYFLVFGGVPMLIVGIPFAVIVLLNWRIRRQLRESDDKIQPPARKL